ncbi:glutathione S-transferase family protein [Erythrobacter sp.]|jgi:glutathione S-transferase|uniref:glutathione S-transferase family protein n=1 Tax=Erythrobacter sp. TaxID=1042 RepID=UPI002EB19993|nr:glutathione S-transferase family protein [Erythrobacter sp.]
MTDDGSRLTLYHNDISTCAQKVRLVLAEKDLAWKDRPLDLRRGDQREPAYRKLNPKGVVPTLVDTGAKGGEAVVTESSIIIEYLDDAFPKPPLRPTDPASRAQMREYVKLLDDKVHAMVGVLSFTIAFRHEYLALPGGGQKMLDAARDSMERVARAGMLEQGLEFPGVGIALAAIDATLEQLDRALARTDYLVGDYSLADAAWTPYLHRLNMLGLSSLWADRLAVAAWWERLSNRPSYEAAIKSVEKPERVAAIRSHAEAAAARLRQLRDPAAEAA